MDADNIFFEDEQEETVSNDTKIFKIIFDNFSETQHERYESWLKSNFQIARIKKIINLHFGNITINDSTLHILASVCKVYVGELIEEARLIMSENGDKGQIQPWHLRESHRRIEMKGGNLQSNPTKKLFEL